MISDAHDGVLPRERSSRARRLVSLALVAITVAACDATGPPGVDNDGDDGPTCDLDTDLMVTQVAPDAIPSLLQPDMVTIGAPGTEYLEDSDRVLGVLVDGVPRAYPHAVLDHHEIVSDKVGDRWVTATFCPLTGSGLFVDPNLEGERLDVGVSGLLFANNLVYYDRTTGDVYGPQLSVEGKCSRFQGRTLPLMPIVEMSWGRWRVLHPNTTVVSSATGFDRNYQQSPYEQYRQDDDLLHPMPVDDSRPLKERVLAIRVGEDGGVGYPFGELESKLGRYGTLNQVVGGEPTAVFYEADHGQTAIAFYATVDGQVLTFEAEGDGTWSDVETGSRWTIDGLATEGPLDGARLSIREDAFVAYWFAWRHFQPEAEVWTG